MNSTVRVRFPQYGIEVEVSKGTTILEAAKKAGIGIRSVCGGKGLCGKCKVLVASGGVDHKLGDRTLLAEDEIRKGYVLACIAKVMSDLEVVVPPESFIGRAKLLSTVALPQVSPQPSIILQRIDGASKIREYILSFRTSSDIIKKIEVSPNGSLVMDLYANKIVDFLPESRSIEGIYGIAVDIGTTKIVVALVDITSGRILGVESEFNRQLIYGEDIVSRISRAIDGIEGLREVQRAAITTVNELIQRLCKRFNVDPRNVYEIVAAGNTAMTFLFVGENPYPLIKSFKEPVRVTPKPYILDARDLGIDVNSNASIYILPCAGRFLGGDVVGDVITAGMNFSEEPSLLIDIGTNAEVVMGCRHWFIGTTAPAGPAFEGWGLRHGVRAVAGAIESVAVDPATLKAEYTTIGNAKPIGICGSGYIDLVAQLFVNGVIDVFGKFYRGVKSQYVREGTEGYEYVVVPSSEAAIGRDIVVTEKDIYNIIDSKSSVCAAISILLKKMYLSVFDVKSVYICGAFGRYLNINSAIAIGMIPEFPNAKITYIGNGSLGGAYLALISKTYKLEAERVAKLMASIELMLDPNFMEEYEAGFKLPGRRELFPTWWERARSVKQWRIPGG
ncbi:MAG: ASKHA domain-containing protein [Ignisphaera sp.]|uniref:DUF4445 domain-containing protein n=1 Tax=Ignisphaera aggregans TaxID=334771 RepID=A0A7J3JRT4_9CREN